MRLQAAVEKRLMRIYGVLRGWLEVKLQKVVIIKGISSDIVSERAEPNILGLLLQICHVQ